MERTKDIELNRRYTCKVRGKDTVVRVKIIDTRGYARHSTVRITAVDEETGKNVIIRSPRRLIAPLGEPIYNIKFGGRS